MEIHKANEFSKNIYKKYRCKNDGGAAMISVTASMLKLKELLKWLLS